MEAFSSSVSASSQKISSQASRKQLVNFVEKVWGHEEWIVNNEKYCGKKLVIKENHRCSLHYHKIKDETFYVLKGKILLETDFGGVVTNRTMDVGDIAVIPPLMIHRFTALEDSELIEFSTQHFEEDSYRVELSGVVALHKNIKEVRHEGICIK